MTGIRRILSRLRQGLEVRRESGRSMIESLLVIILITAVVLPARLATLSIMVAWAQILRLLDTGVDRQAPVDLHPHMTDTL